MVKKWFGAIEAGGTKFICAIGNADRELTVTQRIETTTPTETLPQVVAFFQKYNSEYPLDSIGICSFGPLDLNQASPTYRQIAKTPKPGWSGANIPQALEDTLHIPAYIDTDVDGAALSEYLWGAGQGLDTFMYLTIGTGIGGGIFANGQLVHGRMHPEAGHLLLRHDLSIDPFPGSCPFHKDCFEGLANGPAMQSRWGRPAYELPQDHPAWQLEAHYIAEALVAYTYTLSPQRIILGGGVMQNRDLYPLIRKEVKRLLAGYLSPADQDDQLENYITSPGLDQSSGVLGAIALAISKSSN
jgi:fructokinase